MKVNKKKGWWKNDLDWRSIIIFCKKATGFLESPIKKTKHKTIICLNLVYYIHLFQ